MAVVARCLVKLHYMTDLQLYMDTSMGLACRVMSGVVDVRLDYE